MSNIVRKWNNETEVWEEPKANPFRGYDKWAVTVTLNPLFCQTQNHVEQFQYAANYICHNVQYYKSTIEKVHLSFELTHNNNIHVHMALQTTCKMKRHSVKELMTILFSSSYWGYNDVKPIYNESGWISYMSKGEYFQERYQHGF